MDFSVKNATFVVPKIINLRKSQTVSYVCRRTDCPCERSTSVDHQSSTNMFTFQKSLLDRHATRFWMKTKQEIGLKWLLI